MTEDASALASADLAPVFRQVCASQPFTRWTELEVVSAQPGHVELSLANRPDFAQHHGYLQGALVGFLADTACAFAAASVCGDVVTAQYDLRLLAPGIGERFSARGEVLKAGRRLVTTRAEVFAHSGGEITRIAVASATISPVGKTAS